MHSPQNGSRPQPDPRKHQHRKRSPSARRPPAIGIGAPSALPALQSPQAARTVHDGEESDQDVDDDVEEEWGGRFLGVEAADVVGGEDEGEDGRRNNPIHPLRRLPR